MKPVARIVSICQGGELDGLRFSVATGADGASLPFTVHGSSGELTYLPSEPLMLGAEQQASLAAQRAGRPDEIHPVFQGFPLYDPDGDTVTGHLFTGVWRYEERP